MSYFKRARNHKKSYSKTLDEKIAKAYKEFEKTGVADVILESPSNSTAGLYYADKEIPEVPAVMDDVPDSTGFFGGGTQDANGGDVNDSSTWDTGWNTILDMENASVLAGLAGRPIALTPEELTGWNGTTTSANSLNFSSWGNGGKPHGIAWFPNVSGGLCIGTLTSDNRFVQILVGDAVFGGYAYPYDQRSWMEGGYYGGYSPSEFAAAQAVAAAYEANKNNGNHIGRACWVPLENATSQTYENYTGAKKGTNDATPSYPNGYPKKWALRNLTILGGPNEYEKEAKVPGYTEIVFQDELGKGENLNMSGFQKLLRDLFGLGSSAVNSFSNTGKVSNTAIANALDGEVTEKASKDVKTFISDLKSDTTEAVSNLLSNLNDKRKKSQIGPAIINLTRYLTNTLPDELDNDYLNNMNPNYVKQMFTQGKINMANGKFESKDNIIGTAQIPKVVGNNVEVSYTMDFNDNVKEFKQKAEAGQELNPVTKLLYHALGPYSADAQPYVFKSIPVVGGGLDLIGGAVFGQLIDNAKSLGGAKKKTGKIKISLKELETLNPEMYRQIKYGTFSESNTIEGQVLTEKNHLRDRREAKRALVEKKVGGRVSKVILPGPKDHLTVRAIDMLRQYKVNEKEMQEYATTIGEINQWIRDNPKEYEIWKVRYPANDPRLAELNWRLDQQLKASEEYVDSRFPQNEKLYKKLKRKIEININVTDPIRFKKERAEIVYKKLLSVSRAIKLDTLAPVKKLKEHKIKYKLTEDNRSDWKEDFYVWPSYLCEGMTTGSLFNMALNPTGSEPVEIMVDFSPDVLQNQGAPGTEGMTQQPPYDPATEHTRIGMQSDGTGIGIEGFDGDYLAIAGSTWRDGNTTSQPTSYYYMTQPIDLSKSDSITMTIKAGNNTNGGMLPHAPLYASLLNPFLINDESAGNGIADLTNPDCVAYHSYDSNYKPIIDPTIHDYDDGYSGEQYTGNGIVAHQTGDDITITLDIPEKYRTKGNQIFFSTANGDWIPGYGTDHHRHLDRQTLPVPGIDGQPLNDLWGHDFTWLVARYLSNTSFPESGWFVESESNGKSPARNLGWTLWHNIQSSKHPNWPIGEDATAYGQNGGYQIGQYYYGNGDPLPISGSTQTDHSNNPNPPTDADYEEVGRLVLEHFKDAPLYGIKNIQTSRRLPMNVMVGLDDPAASAFIRIGSGPQEGKTSPKKRKKRVETILKASKEYTDKYVAPDLPGSNATFGDVQASPTGYGEVQDKFADVKDSDIPGKLNTGATPDDVGSPFLDSAKVDSDMWGDADTQLSQTMSNLTNDDYHGGPKAAVKDAQSIDKVVNQYVKDGVKPDQEVFSKFLKDVVPGLGSVEKFINNLPWNDPNHQVGAWIDKNEWWVEPVIGAIAGAVAGGNAYKTPYGVSNTRVSTFKNSIPTKNANGVYTNIQLFNSKGNLIGKKFKNPKTGKWETMMRPTDKSSIKEKVSWEMDQLQHTDKSFANYEKTGVNPSFKDLDPVRLLRWNAPGSTAGGGTVGANWLTNKAGAATVGAVATGYNSETTPNTAAGWKDYEQAQSSVSMYNEMLNQQKDVLIQKSLDLWDKIRENNYQGQDWADRPYYAKNDEEMTAEYLKAGGEDIDAQMAALDAKYKDEPKPPSGSSDPGKLSGELGVGEVKDMVNASPQELENIANEIMSKGSVVDKLKGLLDSAKDTFFDTARAGNVFFDYLTNNLPDVIGVDYLGQEYVDNAFKNATIFHDGRVKVGDNIIGTGQKPYYDPKTREIVIGFNYDFQKNADEFAGSKDQMTWMQKTFGLALYDYIGEYSIDASIKLGSDPISALIGMMTGGILGKAVNLAKFFGGGEHKKGEIRMTAEKVKEMNSQFYYGSLKMDELLMEDELSKYDKLSQKEAEDKAYAMFSDKNIDQEQLGDVFNEVYEANEGFARARTETEAIRDGVKTAQKEYNEAASAWSNAFADNKYTGTKGWLNLPDEQRFEKADMSGDYQTYVADKAFVEKWKADAKKGANVYEIGYNYAEKQPAYKQATKAYEDNEKALDKLSSERAAAYKAVTSFLGSLPPHPTLKGYLDCDTDCISKKIKLEDAARAASAKEDKGQKKRESLRSSMFSIRNSLRDEYVSRNMNQMNLSIKASDTIRSKIKDMKKVYEEKKKVSDELRKTEKERIKAVYDSDWFKKANEQLAKDLLKGWDRHTIENMELETAKDEKDPNKGNWDNFEWDELAGAGGSPGQPYTPPKEDPKNPWVPAPGKTTASGEGGSPGQPYVPPKEDPKNPWVPAPGRDTKIAANQGPSTPVKYDKGMDRLVPNPGGGRPGNVRPKFPLQAKRKKELGSTIADVSQGLSATDAASIAGSQTTSKGTKKKKKYNTKTVVASFKPQGGTLKETTFEKIRKLRKSWDYEGKPTPTETGFPEKEPPERVNGWHPEYGKGHEKRYKKLDPHSAKTMARVKTGDPKVDNIVKKQAKG